MSASTEGLSPTPIPSARWVVVAAVATVVLLLDQLSKWWAVASLADGHLQPVAWTLQFRLAFNTGAAFSLARGTEVARFLPLFVLVVVGAVVWRSRSVLSPLGAMSVGLIIGGAIGNLVDRAFRTGGGSFLSGGVVDFIDFQWWPVFNVADMGVVVGGVLFALVAVLHAEEASPGPVDTIGDTDPGAGAGTERGASGSPTS